jgi:RHS repeat-associated protein
MYRTNSNYFKTHDRYLYQGSEMDKEIKGDGNSYTTTFRQLDPRLGRWMTIDPVIYSWQSPYCSMNNNPLYYNDILGLYGSEKTAKRKQRKAERKFGEDKVGDVYDRNKGKEGQKPNYFQVFGEGKDDKTRVSLDSDGDPRLTAYRPDAVIDNDKDLRNFAKRSQSNGNQLLNTTQSVFSAFDLSHGAKEEMIKYASKSSPAINEMRYVKVMKVASKGLFGAQAILSGIQVYNAWDSNNSNKWGVTGKAGLDVSIGYISLAGGPIGWGVGAIYFIGDAAGWWGTWGQASPATPHEIKRR